MAIRKNKNRTYTADVYDAGGKRFIRVFKKKQDAVDFEIKINSEKREKKLTNIGLQNTKILFSDVLAEYMASKSHLRPKSIVKYKNVITQFSAFLQVQKLIYLNEFTPQHASILYQQLTRERIDPTGNTARVTKASAKTVNFYLQSIRAIFNQEVLKGNLSRTPMAHINNLKHNQQRPEFYTADELNKFFTQEMDIRYRDAFQALLNTGVRFEELANITWDDVDLEKRIIIITPKKGFDTKTYSSQRRIPLNSCMQKIIERIIAENNQSEYVFTSIKGGKLRERSLLNVCKRIATTAGITNRAFLHKFRHTFATHLVMKGVGIEKVQRLLGHRSIVETLSYAHVNSEKLHNDVELLTDLVEDR